MITCFLLHHNFDNNYENIVNHSDNKRGDRKALYEIENEIEQRKLTSFISESHK